MAANRSRRCWRASAACHCRLTSRDADAGDLERYQTVYARAPGAVAAPTAGLLRCAIAGTAEAAGIDFGYVTLHVGAGTFQPMRSERVEEHVMHRVAERRRGTRGKDPAHARQRWTSRGCRHYGGARSNRAARRRSPAVRRRNADIHFPGFHICSVDAGHEFPPADRRY